MSAGPIGEALEQGLTLPASWYCGPEVARLEQERIFRRAWQYVGRADQVEQSGSYFASQAGDVPIVVTRDGDGALRAFVNVCRHRGHEVVRGEGRREALQCPYHAWTYALDGSLRSAPRAEREWDFDRRDLSLVPALVETWGPFVFVNPDRDAAPLAESLGDLPVIVAESGVDLDAVRFRERLAWEVAANWKVVVENFLECYHCPVAHRSFASVVDVGPDAYRLEVHDSFLSQFGEVRASARERNAGEVP